MRGEITTWSASENTRYTRLNLLGWALSCPYALELLLHGSTPQIVGYATANESKKRHDRFKNMVMAALREAINNSRKFHLVFLLPEYEHMVCFRSSDSVLCARSKADMVLLLRGPAGLFILYVEASSRPPFEAKCMQMIVRGVGLYHEFRVPVGLLLVWPDGVYAKLLDDSDVDMIVSRFRSARSIDYEPSPDQCSLCELRHMCSYAVV